MPDNVVIASWIKRLIDRGSAPARIAIDVLLELLKAPDLDRSELALISKDMEVDTLAGLIVEFGMRHGVRIDRSAVAYPVQAGDSNTRASMQIGPMSVARGVSAAYGGNMIGQTKTGGDVVGKHNEARAPRATPGRITAIPQRAKKPQQYATVDVFYATDRERAQDFPSTATMYGGERGTGLSFGTCSVSVPVHRKLGSLPGPSIFRLEFRENPEKHVAVLKCSVLTSDELRASLAQELADGTSRALVFVHGYNVSFRDGIRRTAQLRHDLQYPGPAILYSWPSKAKLSAYPADEASVEWSQPHFRKFIQLLGASHPARIDVLAHSMGNRLLVHLAEMGAADGLGHVVFTAPDVDRGRFKEVLDSTKMNIGRATLYASRKDKALKASKGFHSYPRAGDTEPSVVVCSELDSIDVSDLDTDLGLGHSYFGDHRSVISDLYYLLGHGSPPDERFGLDGRPSDVSPQWWVFAP